MPTFQKRVLTLSVIIAVLAAAYVLGLVFSPASVRRRELETSLVPRFNAEVVTSIRLGDADGTLTLQRRGADWFVPIAGAEYPASKSRIEALLDFLRTTRRSRLVTSNPEAWKDFEVEAAVEKRIRLLDAAEAAVIDLIIGKLDEARGGTYVRLEGSSEVVLVNRMFDYYLNTSPRFWSYLRMFAEDLEGGDINRISVRSSPGFLDESAEGLSYTLIVGEGRERDWTLLDSGDTGWVLDNAKVDRLANALVNMEGASFATAADAGSAGLTAPAAEILLSTAGGRDFRLLVGDPAGEGTYHASLEGSRYVYEVARFRLESVFQPLSELRGE